MYDRILRSELFESNRYLDLHTDTSRLTWISLIPLADDFGNLDGNPKRLWRWLTFRTTLKTEPDVEKVLSELCDADLLRRYSVEGETYCHIPRFRQSRDYVRRLVPASPWDDEMLIVRMVDIKGRRLALAQLRAKAIATDSKEKSEIVRPTLAQPSQQISPTVGTGEGIGEGKKNLKPLSSIDPDSPEGFELRADAFARADQLPPEKVSRIDTRAARLPKDWTLPPEWADWALTFANGQLRKFDRDAVAIVADNFRDYWHAKPGMDGRKLDWLATWRNWFRNCKALAQAPRLDPDDHDPTSPTGIMRRAT